MVDVSVWRARSLCRLELMEVDAAQEGYLRLELILRQRQACSVPFGPNDPIIGWSVFEFFGVVETHTGQES